MLQKLTTRLTEKRKLNSDTLYLKFELTEPREIEFQAGQYILFHIPRGEGAMALKHFSMVNPPTQKNHIEVLAKIIPGGVASEYFMALQEQESVVVQGPAGLFLFHESLREKIFIATSTGIAPLKSILESGVMNHESRTTFLWGLRRRNDVYYMDWLKSIAEKHENFSFKICLSQEKELTAASEEDKKRYVLGRVNVGLEQFLNSLPRRQAGQFSTLNLYDFYICGGRVSVESIRQHLIDKGAPKEQIFFEKF